MKNTKKMMVSGLAFGSGFLDSYLHWGEVYDLKKLEALALEGWIVTGIKGMSYRLIKTDPQPVTYAFDYVLNPREDYFELLQSQGWEHIESLNYVHMFKAPVGTPSFHSSKQVKAEVFATVARLNLRHFLVTSALTLVLQLILNGVSETVFPWVLFVGHIIVWLGVLSAVFFVLSAGGFYQRQQATLKDS